MWVIKAGIHKMLVRMAKREDPDQTASSSEAVWSGPALFVYAFQNSPNSDYFTPTFDSDFFKVSTEKNSKKSKIFQ